MIRLTALTAFILLTSFTARAQLDTLNQRIFLLGDAGGLVGSHHPVIDWISKNTDLNDERNTVIFLGDNIYPLGLPLEGDPTYPEAKRILDYQINFLKGKKAKGYWIPGNHDWMNGKVGGVDQAINQQDYINGKLEKNIQAFPLYGCPGPVPIVLSDKVVLVIVDSQWFLHLHDKPGPGSSCSAKTVDEFQTELMEIANEHPNQLLVVANHHPPHTFGPHGGGYTLKEHIFPLTALNPKLYIPLPILGSVYPITRGVFGNVQDAPHPLYRSMANTIIEVLKRHPYPIMVSGHDHVQQMIVRDSIPFVVSGAGINENRVGSGPGLKYADPTLGVAAIEVYNSGKVEVKFYNMQSRNLTTPNYVETLKTIAPPPQTATSVDTTRPIFDSVITIAANPKLKGNGFKRFLTGGNYRAEWTTPVTVPVLDLTTDLGGLTPVRQGGGKQTRSLRVKDSSGKEWSLRSVEKYPEAAIPADLRQTAARDVVSDAISASYPFGALSMEPLSRAAGIPYLRNRLVYIPDDPRLQRFRGDFKNMLAFMQEELPPGIKKTDNTDEVVLKLAKDNDDHVDQSAVLKARLLDNFVMDFDRHEGQWEWATRDTGKGKIYYPIPKDRDQVFFTNQGLIPRLARKPWLVPEIQGFRVHARDIATFNRTARNFDRTFLNELNENEWKTAVDTFVNAMTDGVIESAMRRQPTEIQNLHADDIAAKLKKRRKDFADEMMEYYRFLSKQVAVVGTNQREQFVIRKNNDGSVQVIGHKINNDSTLGTVVYDRSFDPSVTKEIHIYGLGEDDRYVVEGENSKIKIRIVGGPGNDLFVNNGSGKKVLAYDASFENNRFEGSEEFRMKTSSDPQVNRYQRLNFKYNFFNPGLAFEYNVDDGLFIGLEAMYTKQGFRKEPYGMRHYVRAARALRTGSLHFMYNAEFMKVFHNADLIIRSDFRAPVNVTNFFGVGNNTTYNQELPNKWDFYRARYNISNVSVYLRQHFQSWMRLNFGPSFQYFNMDSTKNIGRVAGTPAADLGRGIPYPAHALLGADFRLDINSKNHPMLPTRGFVLDAGIRPLIGLNERTNSIIQANVDMRIFMNLFSFPRMVLATRFGWGKNYGKYEFPQAFYLSGTDNLRGYRRQRFAGRSMAFNNTELRVKLGDFNTYLFPGSIGVLAFHDIGRVYADNENSDTWHNGYGGGVWIAPIRRFVIAGMLGWSKEEKALPRITFGFQF